ncbi:hypothetical protein MAJHIDBO_01254 [Propionibacterium freudenreichii subsp. shermanii]|nr:hypothetical protein MAJHIDBO_01254 [Propionibacterium freudenreichii subsp. shermanii]SPS09049.1 hypothetical protein MAJHIDBO_01254 [Propionibacterium freudenreichii subsp. shermanii]
MMSIDRKGTKISCTLGEMIFLSSLYKGPSTAAINRGGNTCEP